MGNRGWRVGCEGKGGAGVISKWAVGTGEAMGHLDEKAMRREKQMGGGGRRGNTRGTSLHDGVTCRYPQFLTPAGSVRKALEMPRQSQIPGTPHGDTELVVSAVSQTVNSDPAPTVCWADLHCLGVNNVLSASMKKGCRVPTLGQIFQILNGNATVQVAAEPKPETGQLE